MSLLTIYYALVGLWHGGRFDHIFRCKLCANVLWALPIGVCIFVFSGNIFFALTGALISGLGKATGHGQYMYITDFPEKGDPEQVDPFVSLFFGKEDPNFDNYTRNVFGLSVTGCFATIGSLFMLPYNIPLALGLVGVGLFKGPIYALCKELHLGKYRFPASEALTGFVVGLAIVLGV